MLKKELLTRFTRIAGVPPTEGKLFLETFLAKCAAYLKAGDSIEIEQLGSFTLKDGIIKDSENEIEIILFVDKNNEQIIFNIPAEKIDKDPLDDYFSLSVGKHFIPSEKNDNDDLIISLSAEEQKKSMESKVENIITSARYMENQNEDDKLLIISEDEYQKLSFETGDSLQYNEPEDNIVTFTEKQHPLKSKYEEDDDDIFEEVKPVTSKFHTRPKPEEFDEEIFYDEVNNENISEVSKYEQNDEIKTEIFEGNSLDITEESFQEEESIIDEKYLNILEPMDEENIKEKDILFEEEELKSDSFQEDEVPQDVNLSESDELNETEKFSFDMDIENDSLEFTELIDSPEEDIEESKFSLLSDEKKETIKENWSDLTNDDINYGQPKELSEEEILDEPAGQMNDEVSEEEDQLEEEEYSYSKKDLKRNTVDDEIDVAEDFYGVKKKSNKGFYITVGVLVLVAVSLFAYYKMGYKVFAKNEKPTPVIVERKDDIPVTEKETAPFKDAALEKENEVKETEVQNKENIKNSETNTNNISNNNTEVKSRTKTAPVNTITDGKYSLQISSWQSFKKAETEAGKLKNQGLNAIVEGAKIRGQQWYRVRIYFKTQQEYDSFAKKMQ